MLFNLEKCPVMHMGKGNQELSYEMGELSYEIGGKVLKVSEEERDLGVIIQWERFFELAPSKGT